MKKIHQHLGKKKKNKPKVDEFYSHDFILFIFMKVSDHHISKTVVQNKALNSKEVLRSEENKRGNNSS